jgi:hypothetical protein
VVGAGEDVVDVFAGVAAVDEPASEEPHPPKARAAARRHSITPLRASHT